jgi:hypothetical protein
VPGSPIVDPTKPLRHFFIFIYPFLIMNKKFIAGSLIFFICVLLVVCSGCTSKQEGTLPPATQTPEAVKTPAAMMTPIPTPSNISPVPAAGTPKPPGDLLNRDGNVDPDAAYNMVFLKSQAEIINKTNLLLEAMVPGTMSVQAVYSPSIVYVRAEDLGHTTEKYYDQLLDMKANTQENEIKRVAYLRFLYAAKSSAYHIADAAEAESYGNYRIALATADQAKSDLKDIEANPDLPPTIPYNLLDVFLNEYIGRLQDKVIASGVKESSSGGSGFSLH